MGITVNYILNKIIKYIILYYMRYDINYSQKGGSSFINEKQIYEISNDLLANIIKYIDFKKCKDLIKILENMNELKKKINYNNLNKYKEYEMELPIDYTNKLCDDLNENKKNECLKYVYNCNNNYKLLKTLDGHSINIESVEFNNNGTKIVSGSFHDTACIWDVETGISILTLKGDIMTNSVAFNNNDTMIVSAGFSTDQTTSIFLWDVKTGKLLKKMGANLAEVYSVAFNYDGTKIVSGGDGNIIYIWDVQTGKLFKKLESHTIINNIFNDAVNSVRFNNDGTKIVSGSDDNIVRIWDVQTGKEILTLNGHTNSVTSVSFNHDDTMIVSGSEDITIRIWDVQTGKEILRLEGHKYNVRTVAFNYNSTKIISGSDDNTIKIWDVKTGKEMLTLEGHTRSVSSVAFNHDGTKIVSGSYDKTIKIWGLQ
jgi:WD40 repeat protein